MLQFQIFENKIVAGRVFLWVAGDGFLLCVYSGANSVFFLAWSSLSVILELRYWSFV